MTDNVFTLEDLDAAIEREYAPLRFTAGDEEFVLRSLLRVGRKDRQAVVAKLDEMESAEDADEETVLAAVQFVVKAITADGKGTKLVKLLGDDVVRYMKLLNMWTEATQPGEAQDSQN